MKKFFTSETSQKNYVLLQQFGRDESYFAGFSVQVPAEIGEQICTMQVQNEELKELGKRIVYLYEEGKMSELQEVIFKLGDALDQMEREEKNNAAIQSHIPKP